MSKLLARSVKVVVGGGSPLAGLTDCSLNLTTVFASSQTKEDVTPVDEPLRVDWEISVSGEFGKETSPTAANSVAQIKEAAKVGAAKLVSFEIGDIASYYGSAIVSAYSESAPVDGKITYQVTLKGVSTLNKA